jgi:hypothetical protein
MKSVSAIAAVLLCAPLAFSQQSPQVLFSGPPAATASAQSASKAPALTNAERRAVVIDAWSLDLHLIPRQHSLEAQAQLTLHNAGPVPLTLIPLQLSSSLHFEGVEQDGKALPYTTSTIASDADHTGALSEAAISLPRPLAPGAGLVLTVGYGGSILLTGQRLTAIGAPKAQADASDWDRISSHFTGLRGFGNVVWYPVSSIPVSIADGDTLFREIGRQKLLNQNARMSIQVTDEFFSKPPTAALLNGHFVPLGQPASMPADSFPGVITCSLPATRLGFQAPSLFLARRTATTGNGLRILTTSADSADAQAWIQAARTAKVLVDTWLGSQPHPLFTVLELPEAADTPSGTGNLLATPIASESPQQLASIVTHSLAHAAFWSPRGWLNEGVANFLSTLSIESLGGHTAAMEFLNSSRPALAIAEPASPGQGPGQNLLHAVSSLYYRTKATYVLWMLRDMVGDPVLQAALKDYKPAKDTQPAYFEHLVEQRSGKNLQWFFNDWVYHDHGLPDLSIGGVYPSSEGHDIELVAVKVVNAGYAAADVPITVKAPGSVVTVWVHVPALGSVTHRILLDEPPAEVDVNDGSIPEVQDSIHRRKIKEKYPAAVS